MMDDNEKNSIRQIKKAIFEVIQTRVFRKAIESANTKENVHQRLKISGQKAFFGIFIAILDLYWS